MDDSLEAQLSEVLQFLYACPAGLAELAPDGRISMINPLAMQLLMPIARSAKLSNFFAVMEHYAPELKNMVDGFTAREGRICEDHRVFVAGPDGGSEARVLSCTLVKLSEARLGLVLTDVSKQVAQERRLKQAEIWFASLLDTVSDFAVISLDAEGRIESVNPSVLRQTGFEPSDMLGQSLDIFAPPEGRGDMVTAGQQIEVARRDGWHLDEGWRKRRDGRTFWCQSLIAVRGEADGHDRAASGYTVVLREVARQPHDSATLQRLLTTDNLTGARNRGYFFEAAERERVRHIRQGTPLALIAIDVDAFKMVNDTYGHPVGDEVLRIVSDACQSKLRAGDIFARTGGEEFVVLAPGTDIDGAVTLAETLRVAIATACVETSAGRLDVTASFGCAVMPGKGGTVAALLSSADNALYAAKRSGRNRVVPWGRTVAAA